MGLSVLRRMTAVLTAILLPIVLWGQAVPSNLNTRVPMNPAILTGTLPNGMKYFVLKNGKPANRVEMMLAVNAGAVLEDDDQNGLAHFCEHMAFNGTKSFPKQQLVSFLESTGIRFGADLNAYTNQDETVYMLTVPMDKPTNVEKGLDVLRDWARNVNFTDKDINDERGVIMEEWRLGKGAQDRVFEKHRKVLFYNSKYAQRDIIGDTNVLLRCPPENLRRFYHTWYRPERMAVIVVGDIDPKEIVERIKKSFTIEGSKQYAAKERPSLPLTPHDQTLVSVVTDKELPNASAQIMWKHKPYSTATYAGFRASIAHQLIAAMLGQRTQDLSRKPNPPFLFASAGLSGLTREAGAMATFTVSADKNIMRSLSVTYTELLRAARHGFTPGELERAKQAVQANMEKYYNERDKSESSQFAQELVRHFLTDEGVPGIEGEFAIYKSMLPTFTTNELKDILAEHIQPKNRVVMLSLPEDGGYSIPSENDVLNLLKAVEGKNIEPYVDQVVDKPLVAKAPTPGTITSKETIKDIDAVKLTLSNGAVVFYKITDFKNDEILFSATSWGGSNYAELDNLNNARMAAQIVDEGGIADIDASSLSKMLAGKNLGISPVIADDSEGFSGQSTPKDFKTFFELLHLYFTAPRKDKDAFASMMQKVRSQLENKDKNPEAVFQDSIVSILSSYHPRTKPLSAKDIDAMNLDKAFEFYKQRFANPADFTYYFVGNINADTLEAYLKQYLASIPGQPTREQYKDNGSRTVEGKVDRTIYRGTEKKSTVVMLTHGPMKYTPKDRYDLIALCEVLSIRLREQLREEKGGVYFVAVQPQMEKRPKEEFAVTIFFGCDPTRVDELVTAVNAELDYVKNNLVEKSYIDKVKEIQVKEREVGMKRNAFWLNVMRQFNLDGEPYANVYLRDAFIKDLTPEAVRDAAKKYLTSPNVAKIVLKPEAN